MAENPTKATQYDDAIIYAKRAMHNRKQLLGTHPNTARSIFFVGNIYLNMKKYDVARTHMVEALNMEECLVKSGKSLSADWVNLKTSLPNVCLVLGRNRERSEYFRRFQEIEKMKDENLPPVEEKNSSDEKFSNSDDEEQSTESIEGSNYSEQSKNAKSSSEVQLVNKQRDEELPHGEDSLRKEVVKSLLRNPSQSSTETSDEEIIFEDEHEEPLLPSCSGLRQLTFWPNKRKKTVLPSQKIQLISLNIEAIYQDSVAQPIVCLLKLTEKKRKEIKRYDDAIFYAERAMHNRKQLLGTHPNTARSIFFVGNIYFNMKKYDVARTHMVEALNMEECLVKSGKSLSADWVNLKTLLPKVCLVLGRNRERNDYFRRFQEIEKMKDENLPPDEERISSDEKFSNSDDEEQSTESIEGSNYSEESKNATSFSEVKFENEQRDEELPNGEDRLRKEVVKSLLRNPSQSSTETSNEEIIFEDEHEEPLLPRPHTRSRLSLSRIICCQRLCSCCRYLTRRPRSFKKDDFDNWFPIEPMDTD
uniref:Intracellular protein transport protein USO1-like n=1 Tax=Saccoglossus kowalevskii TaxID=10224 RepID=A0ABM0MFD3_SACKO|nr:PREDICTED: intracellular protein transport protein USO1-like [Saccoglossus kowalevskii]